MACATRYGAAIAGGGSRNKRKERRERQISIPCYSSIGCDHCNPIYAGAKADIQSSMADPKETVEESSQGPAPERQEEMTTQHDALKQALEEIADPIKAMRDRAEAEGMKLDGHWAIRLADSPDYLRNIAQQALAALSQQAAQEPTTDAVSQSDAARYKAQRDKLLAFIQCAPVSSGVCCCGDDIERHGNPMDCGHSPVDQWDHAVRGWVEEIQKSDNRASAAAPAKPAEQEKAVEHALYEAGKMLDVAAQDSEHPEIWRLAAQMIQSAGKSQQAPSTAAQEQPEYRTRYILQRKSVLPHWEDETPGHKQLEDSLACVPFCKSTKERPLRIMEIKDRVAMDQAAIDAALAHKGAQGEKA